MNILRKLDNNMVSIDSNQRLKNIPKITITLIIINILAFMAGLHSNNLFLSLFTHFDLFHLTSNMFFFMDIWKLPRAEVRLEKVSSLLFYICNWSKDILGIRTRRQANDRNIWSGIRINRYIYLSLSLFKD